MKLPEHEPLEELEHLINDPRYVRMRDRVRAVVMARQQWPADAIAEQLGVEERTVRGWMAIYRKEGVAGLLPRKPPGAPPKMTAEQKEAFVLRVTKGPLPRDGVSVFRGLDLHRILEQELGLSYHPDYVYTLLDKLGLSWLCGRPVHEKNDLQAMAEWKENAPFLSAKFSAKTKVKRSKSGFRTKRASASAAR